MHRYYQTGEHSEWVNALEDDPNNPWAFAAKHQACRVAILAMEGDLDILGPDHVGYAGPLFFDIDDGNNLSKAIGAGVELCEKLMSMGVHEDDIEIHLSGSKGIHVFINANIFTKGETEKDMPDIHKRMALDLYVPGMDMQVYSRGKGRQVRPPNSKRDDGKYKVPVLFHELKGLTVEQYAEFVSKPRDGYEFKGKARKSKPLASLYKLAKEDKKRLELVKEKDSIINDLSTLEGRTPPCVEELAKGNRSKSSNFNQIAMNIACWSAKYPVESAVLDSIHTRVVENCPSSSGESSAVRKRKLQALHAYISADKNGKYYFSCGSMKAQVAQPPCGSCAMRVALMAEQGISPHLYIHEKHGQWYSDQDCTNVVATFTMERDAVIKDENTKIIQASIIDLIVPAQGRVHRLHDYCESSWRNKGMFKQSIEGIDGAAFFGSDNDIARIRLTLAKNELISGGEMKEKFKSDSIGIIYRRRHGPQSAIADGHVGRLTYVEQGISINSSGIHDTHVYEGANQPFPKLCNLEWNTPISDEANEAFGRLLRCNLPSVIAPMLGWYLLAHIKTHVYQIEHRGILMCVSGVAGTGKNSLTAVMQRLSGLQGEDALFTLEAPQSTKLPFQQAMSNSTTIPRVINELNPKSLTRKHYQDLMELLKAAFDSQSISRGRIGGNTDKNGGNVSTISWQITAPVITLSEEPIHLPAVRQRAVMVDMTPQGHDMGAKDFVILEKSADHLTDIAKFLVKGALGTSIKDVHRLLTNAQLPPQMDAYDIPSRLKFGYQSILMAYDWAISVLGPETGFSEENLQGLLAMKSNFIEYMKDNSQRISRDSNVTEVDKVIRDLAIMAYSSGDSRGSGPVLERTKHFAVYEGQLFLDMIVIYPLYQRFKAGSPEPISIVTAEAFLQVVRSMSYYITDRAVTEQLPMTAGRCVLALDVTKLQERDIPVTMFI